MSFVSYARYYHFRYSYACDGGCSICKCLTKKRRYRACIDVSTFDENELFESALSTGVDGFLLKGIDVEKLSEAIIKISVGGFLAELQLLNRDYYLVIVQ